MVATEVQGYVAYVTEQEHALQFIRESSEISNEEKKRFFKNINTNLGTTALCLSGGATFGYCKFYTLIQSVMFIVPKM